MTTKAIEAGARALDDLVEICWAAIVGKDIADICYNVSIIRGDLKTALKAAISSGELVPASAVAAERERCAAKCDELGDEIMKRAEVAHEEEEYDEYESLECAATEYSHAAAAIRALEPASGEHVLGWRDISTAPLDKNVQLWWRPITPNPHAESVVIGSISSHEEGKWWNPQRAEYQDVWHVTHWRPLPEPPAMLTAATSNGSGK